MVCNAEGVTTLFLCLLMSHKNLQLNPTRCDRCVLPGGAVAPLALSCKPATARLPRPWLYWCGLGPVHLLLAQPEHKRFPICRKHTLCKRHARGRRISVWPFAKAVSPRFFPPLNLSQSVQESPPHVLYASINTYIYVFTWWIPPLHYGCHSAALDCASFECSSLSHPHVTIKHTLASVEKKWFPAFGNKNCQRRTGENYDSNPDFLVFEGCFCIFYFFNAKRMKRPWGENQQKSHFLCKMLHFR